MVTNQSPVVRPAAGARAVLLTAGQIVLTALMLLAVLALWNTQAPQFIYVAF